MTRTPLLRHCGTLALACVFVLASAVPSLSQGIFDRPTPTRDPGPLKDRKRGPSKPEAVEGTETVETREVDKPPEAKPEVAPPLPRAEAVPVPLPPIEAIAALPSKWKKEIAPADQDKIEAIGKAVADNVISKDAAAYGVVTNDVLANASVLDGVQASNSPPSAAALSDNDYFPCKDLCNDLKQFVEGLDGKRGTGTSGTGEEAATIGDAFFEGGQDNSPVLATASGGTAMFGLGGDKTGQPKRDAGDFERGAADSQAATNSSGAGGPRAGSGRSPRYPAPPPPKTSPPPPPSDDKGEIIPKGVKIKFQAATLRAALGHGVRMATLEDRLINASAPSDLVGVARQTGERASEIVLRRAGAREIDDVILVSLRAVADGAEPYAGRWDEMPDDIRHPGPIRRIHGFLVTRDDIRLIATDDGKGEPLSLDEIAVDAVWRRGAEPLVSLDPDPNDFAGPQWSRVGGVPFDSVFAEVMLEADYEMKFISSLGRNVSNPRFRSYIQRIRKRGIAGTSSSRYWFTPAPPVPGQILTVPDGTIYLYDGRVVLDTEKMDVSAGKFAGTGGRSPVDDAVARNFTELFAEFETEFPIFRRLRALMDISLTGAIWRTIGLRHPVLDRLAALDAPSNPVKRSYEALYHEFRFGRTSGFLAGGVDLATRLSTDSIRAVDDRFVRRLKHEAERSRHALSTRIRRVSLPVISSAGLGGDAARDPILRINVVLQSGDAKRAYAMADKLIRRHPDRAEFLALRVEAAIPLGLYRLAIRDLRRIHALTNADEAVRQTVIRVGIRSGRLTDYAGISTADRRAVSIHFRALAARLSVDPARTNDALKEAETAVALAPGVAENLAVRGSVQLLMKRFEQAGADLDGAIALAPKNAMFRILRARAALRSGAFEVAERHLDVAIENGSGLDVLKYITLRGIARSCVGAPIETCEKIIRSVEQMAKKRPTKKAEGPRSKPENVEAEKPRRTPAKRR